MYFFFKKYFIIHHVIHSKIFLPTFTIYYKYSNICINKSKNASKVLLKIQTTFKTSNYFNRKIIIIPKKFITFYCNICPNFLFLFSFYSWVVVLLLSILILRHIPEHFCYHQVNEKPSPALKEAANKFFLVLRPLRQ